MNVMFYDGDCGICHHTIKWLKALDNRCEFEFAPYQSMGRTDLQKAGLTIRECEESLQVRHHDGTVRSGHEALNSVLRLYAPWKYLVAFIEASYFLAHVQAAVYRLFAAHRQLISRAFGVNTICATGSARESAERNIR